MESSTREAQAKSAAEILLHEDENVTRPPIMSSHEYTPIYNSISSPQLDLINEDLVVGLSQGGSVSPVRRFFCLLVTFDLLFTSLLWLVFVMVSEIHGTESVEEALYTEIAKYNIHSSLFDLVMVAGCRFTILILFYALLQIRNWSVVALCTSTTCAFLIVKVFYYEWKMHNDTLAVMLVLVSFVLSWGESWFLDFRVLPQEKHARELMAATAHSSHATLQGDRAPLLRPYLMSVHDNRTETIASFYSPMETPHDSDEEGDYRRQDRIERQLSVDDEHLVYKSKGAFEKAWRLINEDGWNEDKRKENGDVVYTRTIAKRKIYLFVGDICAPMATLVEVLFKKPEEIPKWNPSIVECQIIQELDEHTKITYQVTSEVGKGMISARDYVIIHHYEIRDGCHVSAGLSVEHKDKPVITQYIRAENGPGAWVIRPKFGVSNTCTFQWLLNTDLKGWLPQGLVDRSLSSFMFENAEHLRIHLKNY